MEITQYVLQHVKHPCLHLDRCLNHHCHNWSDMNDSAYFNSSEVKTVVTVDLESSY